MVVVLSALAEASPEGTSKLHEQVNYLPPISTEGFPHSSVGEESSCNAGDPSLIPGSGRFTGEGMGYPLQYSWSSLAAQLVKNMPVTGEIWV